MVTAEESKWLKRHIPGHTAHEFMDDFEAKFGRRLTKYELGNFKTRTGIRSGVKFIPPTGGWNKDKKMPYNAESAKTQFKKGHKPHNHKKIGSSRVNVDGYIEVKVAEPSKWELKHRVVWKKYRGKIPKGYIVIFLDGNPLNCKLSNLALISKADNVMLNRLKLRGNDADISKAAINTVRLLQKIKKVSK